MRSLLVGGLGTPELLIVLAVVILLFGANKLPELARGSGRALRIFKSEVSAMDDDDTRTPEQRELEARQTAEREALEARQIAERESSTSPVERRDDTTA
jgi:sec-independent protein translocase protein TatA